MTRRAVRSGTTLRGPLPSGGVPITARDQRVLGLALALMIMARLLSEFLDSSLTWGIDYARFLGPGLRFGPWLVALAVAALATLAPVRAAFAWFFRPLAEGSAATMALAAVAVGSLCLVFPDRTSFTGDFALRRSAVAGITDFGRLFPQAMLLDRWLHLEMPRALRGWTALSVDSIACAVGAIEGAIFAALAVAFARRCGTRGLGALVAAATVIGGAALGLFTGYDKSFEELSLVTLAFAVAGLGEISRGRAGWASGMLVALAVALHRSGLSLLPAWLALWAWAPAAGAAREPRGELPSRVAPAANSVRDPRGWPWSRIVPAALIAALLPSVWRIARAVDARHLAPKGTGQMLAGAIEPGRLLAIANLLLFLVPLLLLLPVAAAIVRPRRERPLRWLGLLAVAWLVPMLLVHPVQGEFRDWDDFAPGGVAIALPLAMLLARTSAGAPAPVALALAAVALVPRVQWLALQTDSDRSLARIESWAAGSPAPPKTVAAATLEYVGMAHFHHGRVDRGRQALASAVAQVPFERVYLEWANAEAHQGDWARALELYEEAARRYPSSPDPWWWMTQAALEHGDRVAAERALSGFRRLLPADPGLPMMEAAVRALPGVVPR